MNRIQKPIKMKRFCIFLILLSSISFAQKKDKKSAVELPEKKIVRSGNELYNQNNYVDAETQYKKALEVNPSYEKANYNLGNAIYQQNRFKEALPMYDLVTKTTKDKLTKAENFHNMGNVFMKEKQYAKAIESYKNSLRNNSKDDETRYNLALAQKLLKNEADNKKKDDNNKDKNNDKEDQEKENKDQKDQNKDKQEGDQGDKDKDKKGDNKNDQNKDQQGENDQKKQQPQPQKNKLSKQQIQQLLEAMNNEENKTQKKVNAKKAKGRKVKREKDW